MTHQSDCTSNNLYVYSRHDDLMLYQALGALGTETSRPSTLAQVLAAIAIAELPHGLWDDVMAQLQVIYQQAGFNEPLRVSVLETIGYICEGVVCI